MRFKTNSEIVVETPNSIGILSKITSTICETHTNIKAICGYETDGIAHVRLITDNNKKAIGALKNAGFKPSEHTVLISETSPHVARPQIENFGSDLEVQDNYWCATTHNGEHALLVFTPRDNALGTTY